MRTLAALALLALALPARADDAVVEVDGLKSTAPAAWKQEEPSNNMRLTQFKLPKAEGDAKDAELVVFFFFKGGSGSIEQNLQRQAAKFKKDAKATTEKTKVGPRDATLQDISGTFLEKFPPFAPNAKITEREDYRQLYVIFDGENGSYYFQLWGGAKTVAKHEAAFKDFIKNFK